MKKTIIMIFSTIYAFSGAALAHHSNVGLFDTDVTIELEGTITAVSWRNPHGFIVFDVENESGNIVQYSAETAAISVMRNRGITGDAIQVGDQVTVAGSPSLRGRNEILARNILLSSGYEFDFGNRSPYFPAGKSGNLVGYISNDADDEFTQAAIANADGIFRTWSTIMNDRAAFPMFTGSYPLNETGEAFLAQWNPADNELLQCGTKGTPLIMMTPFPIEFVQIGETIEMRIEEYDALRVIHMDPNAIAPEEHTQFGFSRGRWEGSTLVVETDHIQAGYFGPTGEGQSDQITVVERFMPAANYERMDYRLTVTDPVYFTEPFELTKYFVWLPHMRVNPYECLEREY